MEEDRIVDHQAWPARAALLAALGALLGVSFDLLLTKQPAGWTEDPLRLSLASFVAVSGLVFAFTVERVRWLWSLAFAIACGLVVALVFNWNGTPSGWDSGDGWRIFSALLAVTIAAPLFQTIRDRGERRLGYTQVHAHAWTNIVLWFACLTFVLVTYLLAQLLAELFSLIGIDLLRTALGKSWFAAGMVGAALGAGAGLLRDRDKVLGLLQRVVTTVLSVLAPILALGLILFVAALPFTGLAPLWEKTKDTTPILLSAVFGAFILVNAVIGSSPEEAAPAKPLRWSAMALSAVMAPLAVVAAVSTWLRIDQHGFTPQRLWALIFVIVVLAVSLTYLWSIIRGRAAWAERIRPANIRLAVAICAMALLLATPVANFGAISTRDQLARLEAGKVKPEQFDWAALRFDFGPSGRRALERLQREGSPQFRQLAARALRSRERWALSQQVTISKRADVLRRTLRVIPNPVPLPDELREALAKEGVCTAGDCTLFWQPGSEEAVAVGFGCSDCGASVTRLLRDPKEGWQSVGVDAAAPMVSTDTAAPDRRLADRRALASGRVEVREVRRRQVFIDGRPVGGSF